jgi:uncharacterized protein DUF4440
MNLAAMLVLALMTAGQDVRPADHSGQATGIKIASPTRQVVVFSELERSLLAAQQNKNAEQIKAQLDPGFEFITAGQSAPTPHDEWLDQLSRQPAFVAFRISQLSVRNPVGTIAMVSFLSSVKLDADGKKFEDTFIVDEWVDSGGVWKLKVRYSSPVQNLPHPTPKPSGKQ